MKGKRGQESVTNVKAKELKIRERAKHRCPQKVQELLEIINSIPPDRKFPHIEYLRQEVGSDPKALDRILAKHMDGLSTKLLLAPSPTRLQDTYSFFRHMRMKVRDLANFALLPNDGETMWAYHMSLDKIGSSFFFRGGDAVLADLSRRFGVIVWNDSDWRDYTDDARSYLPSFQVLIDIDPNTGLTIAVRNTWLEALIGIEAKRLRVCKICQRIFWARQDNMLACGSKCSAANRQRLLRERKRQYTESVKKKRQAQGGKKGQK
jgi:hypothetical protein